MRNKNEASQPCINHFIEDVQQHFEQKGSFSQIPGIITQFQEADKRLNSRRKLSAINKIIHTAVVSTPSLSSVALYENMRSIGIPLPDSQSVAHKIVRFASAGLLFSCESGPDDYCQSESHEDWHRRTGVPFNHVGDSWKK